MSFCSSSSCNYLSGTLRLSWRGCCDPRGEAGVAGDHNSAQYELACSCGVVLSCAEFVCSMVVQQQLSVHTNIAGCTGGMFFLPHAYIPIPHDDRNCGVMGTP
jgi:hypothetical protein